MGTQVVPASFKINAGTTPQMALPVNSLRKFLQIINRSAAIVTFKFDSTFGAAASQVQTLVFSAVPTFGTYQIAYNGNNTGDINFNANAATIQALLQALPGIGVGAVNVTGNYSTGFTFTFMGSLANVAVYPFTVQNSSLINQAVQQSATQNITWSAKPEAGTFKLTYQGQETSALNYNDSAATIKTALNLLSTINGGVSAVSQDAGSLDLSITFGNAPLYNAPVDLLEVTSSTLTNSDDVASGVQKIYFVPAPLQGKYRVEAGAGAANVTAELPFDTVAADLQAALEALTAIGSGNIAVTGTYLIGFTLTFQAALADTEVPTLWVIGSTMHPDVLEEPQLRVPEDVETVTEISVAGASAIDVTAAVVTLTPGIAPVAVTTTLTVTMTGQPTPSEGIDLAISPNGQALYDEAVPIGQVWIKAASNSSSVEIFEG